MGGLIDLRERVVSAVETGGLSCNRAAKQFGVGISTAINWVKRLVETGRRFAGPDGRPQARRRFRASIVSGCCSGSTSLRCRRLVAELPRTRAEGGLPVGLGVRPCREAELQKKAWWLANATVPTWRGGARGGQRIRSRRA